MTSPDLQTIERLTADRLGTFDVPCPTCGPERSSRAKQQKPVLRIWRLDPGFATFHCARCGDDGYVRNGNVTQPKSAVIAKMRAEAANHERIAKAERLSKSRWLWSRRQAAQGSIVETYLRDARGYGGPIPATLGFLPAR
jgi:predicted RNA-binding Zn-ribbon protein involved in translation (DUF1610 family)